MKNLLTSKGKKSSSHMFVAYLGAFSFLSLVIGISLISFALVNSSSAPIPLWFTISTVGCFLGMIGFAIPAYILHEQSKITCLLNYNTTTETYSIIIEHNEGKEQLDSPIDFNYWWCHVMVGDHKQIQLNIALIDSNGKKLGLKQNYGIGYKVAASWSFRDLPLGDDEHIYFIDQPKILVKRLEGLQSL